MKYIVLIPVILSAVTLSGCATPGKAALLGSGVGAIAGAGVSALTGAGGGNIIVGGALGGLLGAGTGYVARDLIEKSNQEAFAKGKDAKDKDSTYVKSGKPSLIPPQVESRFVDDEIRGNVFIPAHVEYIIKQQARWSR